MLRNDVTALNQLIETAGEHILPQAPTASATKALLRMGNALVGGDADGCYLGLNAPSGWVGDYLRFQLNAVDVLRLDSLGNLGVGVSALSGFRIHAEADGNFDNMVRVNNVNTGNGAAAGSSVQVRCGGTDTASGRLAAWGGSHASTLRANRVSVVANSDATGITLEADNASQDIRFAVATLGEQMRLSSSAELLLGTTSSLARLAVVGRADQIQCVVRGFSTQTTHLQDWQTSGGSVLAYVQGDGPCYFPQAGIGVFAAQAGVGLFVTGSDTTAVTQVLRQLTSQTGHLLEARDDSNGSLFTFTNIGDLTFNRRSSTTGGRQVADLIGEFVVSTDASRTGRFKLRATDFNATREVLRGEADGTNPKIGFLGANAVARSAAYTPTNVTTDRSFDANSTTLDEIADVLGTVIADMQAFGLFA
jgi:hypothetical protein